MLNKVLITLQAALLLVINIVAWCATPHDYLAKSMLIALSVISLFVSWDAMK